MISDIPMSVAVQAFSGTSFVPEKRGMQAVEEYAKEIEEIRATLLANAEIGGTLALFEDEFQRIRLGIRKRFIAWLNSRGRCMSPMIAGPAKFPVARQQKRNRIEQRRLEESIDYRQRAMRAAIRNLRPDLRPIMAGDSDAVLRLQEQIDDAEALQARMKAANAAIRKYFKEGSEAMSLALQLIGFSAALAEELIKPDVMGAVGFPDYRLRNNNANIRRMKERMAQIVRAKAAPDSSVTGADGIQLDDCPAENRVRLTFPGKPAAEIRAKLKRSGFRWAPSLGVWQAYRNSNSIALAQQMAGALQ